MEYDCYGAYVCRKAAAVLEEKLKETQMADLMREIEMPLSLVLYDMEKEGVEVRPAELKAYGDALVARIEELERSIHEQAGVNFNINSPKQLGEVLFETMGLPGKKDQDRVFYRRGRTGKAGGRVSHCKGYTGIQGTCKIKIHLCGRSCCIYRSRQQIHTNFNQTITATGRISSTEPNLQNIPMRMELGRRIRKVFVPGEGCVFMDADYSQIELRVLAHMSEDEQLIEAYRCEQDIHRITAAKVFHTPFEKLPIYRDETPRR